MPDLLFIYGTLHPAIAPAEIASTARLLQPIGPATIRGTLLDLGDYPGVILDPASPTQIPGHLFALPADGAAQTWARLDRYEDFRPADPSASLFLRQQTLATLPDGSEALCWVYTWNEPVV
jgi:gamma-glutamylcyclotransferase (GGCT)/AIG2-like uncharacterized protein YtfP